MIDLYQVHAPDPDVPLEETLEALDGLVRAGKVRALGVSNFPAWLLAWAVALQDREGWSPFVSLQPQYSLVERSIELELLPFCRAAGLGVIPWGPLGAGFLTGKYERGERAAGGQPDRRRGRRPARRPTTGARSSATSAVVDAAGEIAEAHGATIAQVALAWLLGTDGRHRADRRARARSSSSRTCSAPTGCELSAEERARLEAPAPPPPMYPQRMLLRAGRAARPGSTLTRGGSRVGRYTRLSSRSRSRSSFHAPTEARTSERPGRSRTTTPGVGEPVARLLGERVLPADERRRAARHHGAAALAQRVGEPARVRDRARLDLLPAGGLEQLDRRERERDGLARERRRVEARGGVLEAALEARRRRRSNDEVAGLTSCELLRERGVEPEEAGAVGAAQPLLAGRGVGDAAERARVDVDRAGALRAVEDHRDVELGQRRRARPRRRPS